MIRTFEAARTKFYDNYETWAKAIEAKGWRTYVVHGGMTAQDVNGTCRGFWAYSAKKGWIEQ